MFLSFLYCLQRWFVTDGISNDWRMSFKKLQFVMKSWALPDETSLSVLESLTFFTDVEVDVVGATFEILSVVLYTIIVSDS